MTSATLIAKKTGEFFIPSPENRYTPGFLKSRTVFYIIAFLLIAKIAAIIFLIPSAKNIFLADVTGSDLFSMLNESRQSHGLNPLVENKMLDQAALMKAQDMVANNYFAHQSPQGITPWYWFAKAGYQYAYAGENLAVGFVDSRTLFDAWLNSPEHRANILNIHYTQVGTATVQNFGSNDTILVVQDFGSPQVAVQGSSKSAKPAQKLPVAQQPSVPAPVLVTAPPAPASSPAPVASTPNSAVVLSDTTQSPVLQNAPQSSAPAWQSKILQQVETVIFALYGNGYLQLFSYALLLLAFVAAISHIVAHRSMAQRQLVFRSAVFIMMLGTYLALNQQIINYMLSRQI